MKIEKIIVYFLLVAVYSASAQYFYLSVYFSQVSITEFAFILVTIGVTIRAIISPFIAQLLRNHPKTALLSAFSFQSVFALILSSKYFCQTFSLSSY